MKLEKEILERRLAALNTDLANGRMALAVREEEVTAIRAKLLRIEGAKMVVEELLKDLAAAEKDEVPF